MDEVIVTAIILQKGIGCWLFVLLVPDWVATRLLDFKPMEIRSEVTVTVSALVAGLMKYASEEHWPIKSEPRWSEISGAVFVSCSTCVHCIVVLTNGFAQFFA